MRTLQIFSAILVFLLLAVAVPSFDIEEARDGGEPASGTRATLNVGQGQTYSMIQDAIDAANSGDTIQIHPGMYVEHITVDKTLNILGSGQANTFLQPYAMADAVSITASDCRMENISVNSSYYTDYGIYFEPTLLVDVDHTMTIVKDETFGPVIPVMRVADESAALLMANLQATLRGQTLLDAEVHVRVGRAKILIYTFMGALAALGGILLAARLGAGDPKAGQLFELTAIAAVVVGGTSTG